MKPSNEIDPAGVLAVILGASSWPEFSGITGGNIFSRSADEFITYLKNDFGVLNQNILSLFDDKSSKQEIDNEIRTFVKIKRDQSHPNITDLIVYYTGHGTTTVPDGKFMLLLKSTERGTRRDMTGYWAKELSGALNDVAHDLRKWIFLDCCASAAAFGDFAPQNDEVLEKLKAEADQIFPPSGTALLCASSADEVALAPKGEAHTMFTGALLETLKLGDGSLDTRMNLEDVYDLVRTRINDKFVDKAVRPEVHCPDQTKGNLVKKVPFFPNPSWSPETLRESVASPDAGQISPVSKSTSPDGLSGDLAEKLESQDVILRLGVVAELKRLLDSTDLQPKIPREIIRSALEARLHEERDIAVYEAIRDALITGAKNKSRRQFMIGGMIGVIGTAAGGSYFIWRGAQSPRQNSVPSPESKLNVAVRRKRMRIPRRKHRIWTIELGAGFYIHAGSKILHYVTRGGFIRHCDPHLSISNLRPVEFNVMFANWPGWHQNLQYASINTEEAALKMVSAKDYEKACGFLLQGIRDDWVLKQNIRRNPSYRLYDLLAAISVRRKQEVYLREMVEFVTRTQNYGRFSSRIGKWTNFNSSWHRHWRDHSHRRLWRRSIEKGNSVSILI